MRNKIVIILVLICAILLIIAVTRGIKIGNFQMASISQLIEKNQQLEVKIVETNNLTSMEYPNNIDKLEDTFKDYSERKKKYEQLTSITKEEDNEIYETKQYNIEYLWRIIGAYATEKKYEGDEGLTVALDVKKSNVSENAYDFEFTVTGEYTRISQFLIDVENDSDLYFRIYGFRIVGKEVKDEAGNVIKIISEAKFKIRNVGIDISTISK